MEPLFDIESVEQFRAFTAADARLLEDEPIRTLDDGRRAAGYAEQSTREQALLRTPARIQTRWARHEA